MHRSTALGQLPSPYAVGLRLEAGGATDSAIAGALDLPIEPVPLPLEITRPSPDFPLAPP